ncbi:MAG: M1 family aminopeptidase, partial [Candidatus Aminicenantes bacterium]|nr:M1 family aminopeptidase [Candidatus Aminicenantes bacterium]
VNRLRVFHFQEDKEGARMVLDAMRKTMELFTDWFGSLKDYQGFVVIEISEGFGSQTDVTCIIQTRSAFQSKEQLYKFYHEISHLWGVEARDPLPSRFESEGLAMFLQYLAQEKLEHKTGALEKGAQRLSESFRQECLKNPKCREVPVIDYGKEMLTDLSYSKGMILFYVLYNLVGEDEFFKIIGTFYQKYNQTGATTDNFVNHAREVSPIDLTKFFEEWVYGTESSEYIINEIPIEEIVKKYRR